jgi:phospholipid/cholesterol/gamma-HCH transport system permease protein
MAEMIQGLHGQADRLGAATLHMAREICCIYKQMISVFSVGLHMRWLAKPAVVNVVIRQIYFTGVQSLPWVLMIAVGVGVLSVYNIVGFAKSVQDLSLIGRLISNLLVLEVAPLIVTMLLLARSGVAVVTELGTMHVRGEDMTLRSLGINIDEYLLWPRLMAFTLCGLILTFMFVFVSIWLGGLVVAWGDEINFVDFLYEVRRGTSMEVVGLLIAKGALYPMLSAIMLLYQGCRVGREPNLIPVHATYGVLGSLVLVIMSDAIMVLIRELL